MMSKDLMRSAAAGIVMTSLALAAALAGAQEAGSRQTREFVQAAASSDQFEMLAAQAALTQSTRSEVRAFAAHMLEDHRQLAKAVVEAAARSGLKPPEMAMSADQAQLLGALQGVNGDEFDAMYLKHQVLAHRSALTVEQMYAKDGDDPKLRELATSSVPVISAHAEMANEAAAKLGGR